MGKYFWTIQNIKCKGWNTPHLGCADTEEEARKAATFYICDEACNWNYGTYEIHIFKTQLHTKYEEVRED